MCTNYYRKNTQTENAKFLKTVKSILQKIYSGGSSTEHSNSESIQNPNILKIGNGMVWFLNGRYYSYSYVHEPIIWKHLFLELNAG